MVRGGGAGEILGLRLDFERDRERRKKMKRDESLILDEKTQKYYTY